MMENPVFNREFRTRLRSRKTRAIRLAVGIPAALVIIVSYYQLIAAMCREVRTECGEVWVVASFLQLLVICFIVPGLTANAISQEKEQRTWGLLLITRLSAWQIIWGKLVARLMPIPILMIAFVPFQVYSAVASGMPAYQTVGTYVILLACVFFFAAQAFFWSWAFRRTSVAISAAYGTVFFFTVGTLIIEGLAQLTRTGPERMSFLMRVNPFFVLGSLLDESDMKTLHDAIQAAGIMSAIYVAAGVILLLVMKHYLDRSRTE